MIAVTVHADLNADLAKIAAACSEAEKVLIQQIEKDTRPYVPALTMSLNQRTHIVGNTIVYPGPYARYLFVGVAMVDAKTGKGPMKIPEVGYRFRKGSKLRPTERPLHYTKTLHPLARDHWTEAATAKNLQKWRGVAERAVDRFGR